MVFDLVSTTAAASTRSPTSTQFTTKIPVTTATSQLPVTTATTQIPITTATTKIPITTVTTQIPITSVTTQIPRTTTTTTTQLPVTTATTQVPVTTATTYMPVTTATTQIPVTTAATYMPVTTATTQIPVTTSTTQIPVTTTTTQLPVTTATTHMPVTTATTQIPVTTGTTQIPVTTATTQLPVTTATTQMPVTTATTQIPVTTATTKILVTIGSTTIVEYTTKTSVTLFKTAILPTIMSFATITTEMPITTITASVPISTPIPVSKDSRSVIEPMAITTKEFNTIKPTLTTAVTIISTVSTVSPPISSVAVTKLIKAITGSTDEAMIPDEVTFDKVSVAGTPNITLTTVKSTATVKNIEFTARETLRVNFYDSTSVKPEKILPAQNATQKSNKDQTGYSTDIIIVGSPEKIAGSHVTSIANILLPSDAASSTSDVQYNSTKQTNSLHSIAAAVPPMKTKACCCICYNYQQDVTTVCHKDDIDSAAKCAAMSTVLPTQQSVKTGVPKAALNTSATEINEPTISFRNVNNIISNVPTKLPLFSTRQLPSYQINYSSDEKLFKKLKHAHMWERFSYGFTASDIIIDCQFNGVSCSASNFRQFYNSLYGNCFSFNSNWNNTRSLLNSTLAGRLYGKYYNIISANCCLVNVCMCVCM